MTIEVTESASERRRRMEARRPPPRIVTTAPEEPPDAPEPLELPDGDEEAPAAPAKAKAKTVPPPATPAASKVIQSINRADDIAIKEYIDGLVSEHGVVRVTVVRVSPQVFNGHQVGGVLGSYSEPVDEEEIQQAYGGGKYTLKIQRQNNKGSWTYLTNRNLTIAGDPKLPGHTAADHSGAVAAVTAATTAAKSEATALQVMANLVTEQAKTRHPPPPPPVDFAAVSQLVAAQMAPMQAMMQQLQHSLDVKDKQLQEERNRERPDPLESPVLGRIFDFKGAEIQALKANHESELRQLKEQHRDDLKRLQDAFDRDRSVILAQHDRELSNLKAAYEMQGVVTKSSSDMQIKLLEASRDELKAEIKTLREEVKSLRERKDQTIGEKIKEVTQLKEIVGGDGDDKSTALQVAEAVLQSPLLGKIGERIAAIGQAAGPPPQQQAAAGPQAGMIYRGPNGEPLMMLPTGQVVPAPAQMVRRKRVAPAAPAADATGTPGAEAPAAPQISVDDARLAVRYIEQAYQNGTDPDTLAQSVRSMVPEPILQVIRQHGVDELLDKVAPLDSGSPLSQQAGRMYARKVAQALLTGGA